MFSRLKVEKLEKKAAQLSGEHGDLIKIVSGGDDIWQREQYIPAILPTVETP